MAKPKVVVSPDKGTPVNVNTGRKVGINLKTVTSGMRCVMHVNVMVTSNQMLTMTAQSQTKVPSILTATGATL